MKKIVTLFCLFNVVFLIASAQLQKGEIDMGRLPVSKEHYLAEYSFDQPTDSMHWLNEKSGMHVSFVRSDKHYFRTETPGVHETTQWEATGWKGERLNVMILVWSTDTLSQVRFTLHDLPNNKGGVLQKNAMQLNLVRYVISNYPYDATNTTCDVSPNKNGFLMPDRFEGFERFDLPGRTVRPVWLSVNVPAAMMPGIYHGTIDVNSEKYHTVLEVNIKVQNQLLPKPHEWQYRLDLWQNPWMIAWYNQVRPWSKEHKALLQQHLKLYADAGGKYITTYAVHSPWSDNSYGLEETMIEWIKQKNGGWKFEYDIFDQYVQLAMETGIDKAITIYTPVPWGNRFRYLDEKTGNYEYGVWPPGSAEFKNVWNIFLSDLRIHLQKKGWLEKTYLGINETTLEETMAAIKVIKEHSSKWKITYAGNWHKELDGLLSDYSFLYGYEPSGDTLKVRAARGATSTFYVCCNPPKPNDFIFSPPAEGRWLSWYSAARGYNGFLRWAYDAWPADPSRDARHTLWPAGDCFLVYPGGNTSLRLEKLREGITDFEKIRILKKLAAKSTDKKVKKSMDELNALLQSFISEHDFNTEKIAADMANGRMIIDRLSDELHP
jgi:Glycoside hydrolase 123, catalytic domain/Glycoside hydrolase 123 N-terminal domain